MICNQIRDLIRKKPAVNAQKTEFDRKELIPSFTLKPPAEVVKPLHLQSRSAGRRGCQLHVPAAELPSTQRSPTNSTGVRNRFDSQPTMGQSGSIEQSPPVFWRKALHTAIH